MMLCKKISLQSYALPIHKTKGYFKNRFSFGTILTKKGHQGITLMAFQCLD
jgi:hypothetical protein